MQAPKKKSHSKPSLRAPWVRPASTGIPQKNLSSVKPHSTRGSRRSVRMVHTQNVIVLGSNKMPLVITVGAKEHKIVKTGPINAPIRAETGVKARARVLLQNQEEKEEMK